MNNNNLESPEIVVINRSGMTAVPSNHSQYLLLPLMRTTDLFELAIREVRETELYGITRLANELRQTQIITEKGGITPEQKLQLKYLMMACGAELRAVSTQLMAQLLEILSQ